MVKEDRLVWGIVGLFKGIFLIARVFGLWYTISMKNVIYQIVNLVTGMRYIGSTTRGFTQRTEKEHRARLRNGKHENPYLQRSWNKHGDSAFIFEALEYVDCVDDVLDVEQSWINKYDFETELYNIAENPLAPMLGRNHTQETRDKISAANSGENNYWWGKHGEEHPMFGKTHSKKTKDKISKGRKDKKAVCQIDKKSDEIIFIYDSIHEAAKANNISYKNISIVCNKTMCWHKKNQKYYLRKTAGGVKWEFADKLK